MLIVLPVSRGDSVIISPAAAVSGFINSDSGSSSVLEWKFSTQQSFYLKLPLVFSAAHWLRTLLRASEHRRKTCRPRTAKEARFHAKESKWQPCCYSSFQCDVILALRSMFVLSLRDSATSKSLFFFGKMSHHYFCQLQANKQKIWGPPAFCLVLGYINNKQV